MTTTSVPAGHPLHARTITTARHPLLRRAGLWTGFLAFVAIAFGPPPVQAAVIEAWVHRFSNVQSNAADQAVKVVHDAAGDVVVTGTTYGIGPRGSLATVKYSGKDGSVLWQHRFTPGTATGLAADRSGNVVVTGYSYNSENLLELYTAKYAAPDGALLWERRHDGGYATCLAVDGSGNVVITGTSEGEYYTAKYAAVDGERLWERRYRGPGSDDHRARAVAVDASGDVVVTGSSSADFDSRHNRDYYTAKYAAADGALLWERRYDGPANLDDEAMAVMVDGSGNVMVTGYSVRRNGDPDYYTAKYAAANGALLWEKHYNGPANSQDSALALALDSSGNVVVTGTSYNGIDSDLYTAKYAAADGALLWEQRYSGPATGYANAVAVDGSGNVVVTGESQGNYHTVKYAAADGALLWEKTHNCSAFGLALARAVAVDDNGNVVVTGFSGAWLLDKYEAGDYCTVKYAAADGALLWEESYDGSAPNSASTRAAAVDTSGNVAVTGVAYNRSKNGESKINADYYTARYAAADGALLWEKRYNGPENGEDEANAVGVDASGNVVVTGYSARSSGDHDYYTAKYAAANGALLWEKRYNGPENGGDAASALALDGSGNVVVTGASVGGVDSFGNPTSDYYTAKYAAADGQLLWDKRYNGPANRDDFATAVRVDGSGNVVVTGYSSSSSRADYYTAKYAAADGALLWEQRYIGPGSGSASSLAIDGSDNVVVTGTLFYPLGTSDFHTIKYAAADGAVLWHKRYNGPKNGYDQPRGVSVDGSGNVVVMGSSDQDFYTVKLAAADGAVLWQKRYSASTGSEDRPSGVAVDGSGNVYVTGSTSHQGYYTIKYAAADGATLWEKRFSESASGDDSSLCLALGPDGRVVVAGSSNGGYATVVYREVPEAISITLIPTGIRLRFSGAFGRSCNIERALVATGPWTTINTLTAPASGLIEYLDASPPAARAFYRASEP